MLKLFAIILALASTLTLAGTRPKIKLLKFHKPQITSSQITRLKSNKQIKWWTESSKEFLITVQKDFIDKQLQNLKPDTFHIDPESLFFVQGMGKKEIQSVGFTLLIFGGRTALVSGKDTISHNNHHHRITPFQPNQILDMPSPSHSLLKKRDENTIRVIGKLDIQKYLQDVEALAAMNRFTTNRDQPGKVENWVANRFLEIENLNVSTQKFTFRNTTAFNIIATQPSNVPTEDTYIIGAHFDSTSEMPEFEAPGAEDNASGTAALFAIARAFENNLIKANLVFVAFGAEEQGLHGSSSYVAQQLQSENAPHIKGVLTMDMIGYRKGPRSELLIETSRSYANLVKTIEVESQRYSHIKTFRTYNYWGSDHVPFIDNKIPAVLLIENFYSDYPAYHRSNDLPHYINRDQAMETMKVATAVLSKWVKPIATAPPTGVKRDDKASRQELYEHGISAQKASTKLYR